VAYVQITPPPGTINNLPPAPFNGNHETIQGAFHLQDAMNSEIYTLLLAGGLAPATQTTDASPASGAITAYAPAGFGSTTGLLNAPANNSGTSLNDLTPGVNNQQLRIRNTGATGILTLISAYSGSVAAHRFSGVGNVDLAPGDSLVVTYYTGSVNRWVM